MTRSAFIAMPRAVGAGSAQVEMTIEGRHGTFLVRYKNKRGTLAALIRMLAWPFTARAAAKELKRTNEELQERFLELEAARAKLDRQATLLRTAHSVNELVQRNLDLGCTLETVASALVEQAGFLGAEIELADGGQIARSGIADFGDVRSSPLTARGGGRWPRCGGSQPGADREQLVDAAFVAERWATLDSAISDRSRAVGRAAPRARQAHGQLAQTVDRCEAPCPASGSSATSARDRTPLAIIMVAADDILLRAGPALEARARAGLGVVIDSARLLVRLVDELLLPPQTRASSAWRRATDLVCSSLRSRSRPAADAAGIGSHAARRP
jgi:hypothetical protein